MLLRCSGAFLSLIVLAAAVSPAQAPIETTPCELALSPEKFDGKLVRVDAYISQQFEDFTLHHPSRPEEALVNFRSDTAPSIWVEYGDYPYSRVKPSAPRRVTQLSLRDRIGFRSMHQRHKVIWAPVGASLIECLVPKKKKR